MHLVHSTVIGVPLSHLHRYQRETDFCNISCEDTDDWWNLPRFLARTDRTRDDSKMSSELLRMLDILEKSKKRANYDCGGEGRKVLLQLHRTAQR